MNLDDLLIAVFLLVWLIPSLTLHEYGHAKMADRLGDRTPRLAGRLTLNPIPHIDPFGTVILPGLLLLLVAFGRTVLPVFAFAKPTPFNPNNFRDPNKGTMWTAFAGPGVNLILALIAAVLLRILAPDTVAATGLFGSVVPTSRVGQFLAAGLVVNVILFVFNLMPIPGLDGSKVLARFLPDRAREVYRNLDQYLVLFVMVVVFILPGPFFAIVSGLGNGICSLIVGGDCI
jgi:Zn-dependent protease